MLILLLIPRAFAAISIVAQTTKTTFVGTTVSSTVSSTLPGDTLIEALQINLSNASGTASDINGDTFNTGVFFSTSSPAVSLQIIYASNIGAGTTNVTTTFPSSMNGSLMFYEVSGLAKSNPIDVTASSTNAGNPMNGPTLTTNFPSEFLVEQGSAGNTTVTGLNAGTFTDDGRGARSAVAHQITTSTGSYSASWTISVSQANMVAGAGFMAAPQPQLTVKGGSLTVKGGSLIMQ